MGFQPLIQRPARLALLGARRIVHEFMDELARPAVPQRQWKRSRSHRRRSSSLGAPNRPQGSMAAIDRVLARPSDPGNGLQRCLAVFALGAFVIGAVRRIGTNHQKIAARGKALMTGAGGKDGDIAGLQYERATL